MKKIYKIEGNNILTGVVPVDGSKNAALPIICAALLIKGEVILHNVPDIKDVRNLLDILKYLNIYFTYSNNRLVINALNIENKAIPKRLTEKFRASYYLLGALINLFDYVEVGKTGGCNIGTRPIDQHVLGFESLGLTFIEKEESYILKKENYHSNKINFETNSLGASINVLLACLSSNEEVTLTNVSIEPEFIDFVEFLKACGFVVDLDLDQKTISVEPSLIKKSVSYQIMYDRLEAGSYAILGALLGKDLLIKNFPRYDLSFLLDTFDKMNVKYALINNDFQISASNNVKPIDIQVAPFPGFATDLQQILSILLLKAEGVSSIKDDLFPNRFGQLDAIGKKKINYQITDRIIIIGSKDFYSGYYIGSDLRGSMALLIYCLCADGISYLDPKSHLDRGYAAFLEKLTNIGAKIYEEEVSDD